MQDTDCEFAAQGSDTAVPDEGAPRVTKYRGFIVALAQVKKACAATNAEIGALTPAKAGAISSACDEMAAGGFDSRLAASLADGLLDAVNAAADRVLAARATGLLAETGEAVAVDARGDVNMGQSSLDAVLTAMSLALYDEIGRVLAATAPLERILKRKADEFGTVVKVGRFGLRDGVPTTLGQEFSGYLAGIERNRDSLERERLQWSWGVLGATAAGTGLGCAPGFRAAVYRHLSALCGREIRCADNLFDGLQARDSYIVLHARLLALATAAGRIGKDVRLMSSGPRGGLGEIALPAVQPGSSIMPGKVNPVIADQMMVIAQRIAGNQAGIDMAASSGELDGGSRSGLFCRAMLDSIDLLCRGLGIFTERCVAGITANREHCREMAERPAPLAAAAAEVLGPEAAARIERAARRQGITFREAASRDEALPAGAAADLADAAALAAPEKAAALFAKYR